MRSGEVRTAREYLGLSRRGLAQLLRVSEATVQNWEKGKYAPPQGVVSEIRRLESVTARTVQAVLDAARARRAGEGPGGLLVEGRGRPGP